MTAEHQRAIDAYTDALRRYDRTAPAPLVLNADGDFDPSARERLRARHGLADAAEAIARHLGPEGAHAARRMARRLRHQDASISELTEEVAAAIDALQSEPVTTSNEARRALIARVHALRNEGLTQKQVAREVERSERWVRDAFNGRL